MYIRVCVFVFVGARSAGCFHSSRMIEAITAVTSLAILDKKNTGKKRKGGSARDVPHTHPSAVSQ